MTRLFVATLLAAGTAQAVGTEPAPPAADVTAKVEFALKTPRARDPVLGGAKDKAFVSVWLPAGVKAVRGGVCNPFSKGDAVGGHWQAACRHWGFAYVQIDLDGVRKDEFNLLAAGLADLAKRTGHPELEHLPLCFIGMSRGGGISMHLADLMPARTIAVAPVCLEVGPASDATRHIPTLTIFGEKDGQQMKLLTAKLPAERGLGARFGIAVQWNRRHEFALANNLAFVHFDDAIARRLPAAPPASGPVPLADVPLESGWLGDVTAWANGGPPPAAAAWADYPGDKAAACWFVGGRTAAVWRAFVGGSPEVTIRDPAGLGDGQRFAPLPAGRPAAVRVAVAEKLAPRKVELWDADRKLAESAAAPWAFDVPLSPGVHSLIAVAEDAAGTRRPSRPHTVVVTR